MFNNLMFNEVLWFVSLLFILTFVLLCYKLFKEVGLYACVIFFAILAGIHSMKTGNLFGLPVALGSTVYGGIFLSTDILSEKYGRKKASQAVLMALLFMIFFNFSSQLILKMTPTPSSMAIQENLVSVFGLYLPVTLASLITFFITQNIDILIFTYIKKKTEGRWPWLRNNASTIISQSLDSFTFLSLLILFGVFNDGFWPALMGQAIIKILVALLDTPFFYLAKSMNPTID